MATSLLFVGVTPDELLERIAGAVWERWTEQEPDLRTFTSPLDPAWLRHPERDQALGALIRLAAIDGGDEVLAAIAVCHRMRPASLNAIQAFGLDQDGDAIVVGALWESIRTFPWRRRSKAYATHLCHDTRLRVLRFQTNRRHQHDRFRCIYVGSDDLLDWAESTLAAARVTEAAGAHELPADLYDLLAWARGRGVLSEDDLALLRDLIAAAHAVADEETPWTARGISSQAALCWLAERAGTSPRTLRRRRDGVIRRLRVAAPEYLSDVA